MKEYKILELLPIGTAVYDNKGNLVYSNQIAKKICRNVPKNLTELEISREDTKILQREEILSTSKNSYYQIMVKPVNKLGQGCVVVFNESPKNKSLWYLATHDKMTGLYNRGFFEVEIERLKNGRDFPMAIIYADLDNLKVVNDEFGHEEGDKYIIAASKVLKLSLRKYDILSRVGGDEFLALLPKTNEDSVRKVVNRINKRLEGLNKARKKVKVSISVGFSVAEKGSDLKKAIKKADKEMYKVKKTRKKK
jgi:diguanylate cyclase (GGDEF)-like protein